MASFLDDIFSSITGQQTAPQQTIIPTSDLLNQAMGTATAQIPGLVAYNQALGSGLLKNQIGFDEQVFGPSAGQLQKNYYQSVLDQLNLGESLSPELTGDIQRKLLETGAYTGFGVNPGGIGNVVLQTALEGERRGQIRRNEASGAVGALPSSRFQAPINMGIQPQEIAGMLDQEQAAKDNLANATENIRRSNFASILNTGGRILGTVAGAFAGPGGAAIGGSIGGSLVPGSRVAGQPQASGGGGFDFLSSLFGNIGGPRYGVGSRTYYPGGGQPGIESVTAQGLDFGPNF